jgi:hypothetical protein
MKKTVFRIAVSVIMIAILTTVVIAAPSIASTTKALSTNFTLINLGTSTASVSVSYYKDNGDPWPAAAGYTNFTIASNYGQKILAQYAGDSGMSAGRGSAVVSSNEALGSVVQVLARNQTASSGAYVGFSSGATKFYAPIVMRQRTTGSGLTNTQIMIQNVETTAITVDVNFVASPGSGFSNWTKSGISIPASSSYYYDVADELPANLPNGWYGSAEIVGNSSKNIVVVVSIFSGANSMQVYNAFPDTSAGTVWAFPQFTSKLSNGMNMPITAQNLSGSTMVTGSIQLDCLPTTGYTGEIHKTNPSDVVANASYAFNPYANPDYPNDWSGSCVVTAPGNIVAYAQIRFPGVNDNFAAFEGFNKSSTNTKVVIPLASKRQVNGFATAIIIQNLSTTDIAYVRLTYIRSATCSVGDPSYTLDLQIDPNANLIQNLRSATGGPATMPNTWYGSLVVEAQPATTAQPIAGYVQLTNYLNPAGDTFMAHNAVLLP